MPVLGTAGHVDHGKTTFLRHLTKMDPDRLPEEKKRGMTLDLGYVWLHTKQRTIGLMDVPGHSKFTHNMITGMFQIDAFLFFVAADDGWMPQSEEHLNVLWGLGIDRGIVILSKCDLVTAVRVKEVMLDAQTRFETRFGKSFPVYRYSDKWEDSLLEIRGAVEKLCNEIPVQNVPRTTMWIDRSFSKKGQGTVVTGTLRGGTLSVAQSVYVWPAEAAVPIRSLQSYAQSVTVASPDSRVAVQVKIPVEAVSRGSLLSAQPIETSCRLNTELHCMHELRRPTSLRFQMGTLEGECFVNPGRSVLSFRKAIPVLPGQRFLLRSPGKERTVGYGTILGAVVAVKHRIEHKHAPASSTNCAQKNRILEKVCEDSRNKKVSLLNELLLVADDKDLIYTLAKEGLLVKLARDIFCDPTYFASQKATVQAYLKIQTKASTSELKEVLGASRKTAVLLLERMDEERLTYLRDGVRRLLQETPE